jgi:hypothetical protein
MIVVLSFGRVKVYVVVLPRYLAFVYKKLAYIGRRLCRDYFSLGESPTEDSQKWFLTSVATRSSASYLGRPIEYPHCLHAFRLLCITSINPWPSQQLNTITSHRSCCLPVNHRKARRLHTSPVGSSSSVPWMMVVLYVPFCCLYRTEKPITWWQFSGWWDQQSGWKVTWSLLQHVSKFT